MDVKDFIAIAGVLAVLLGPLVTWWVMKKQYTSKKITYDYLIDPIVKSDDEELAKELKVSYKGEDIKQPALLSLTVVNSGLTSIENLVIKVYIPDTSYLIPCYFVNKPHGYKDLWEIKKVDNETCEITFSHINRKQIAEIRFLMDEALQNELKVTCAMPNVEFIRNKIFFREALKEAFIATLDSAIFYPFKFKL